VAAFIIAAVLGHHSTGTTASAPNTYTNPPSSYTADSPATQAPTPTRPTFAAPPAALQGEDQDGDAQCAGGFGLPRGYRVSPATPNGSGAFTSCAFAIVVGQSFLASNPEMTSPQTSISIAAQSPRVNCPDVQSNNPNVQCSGNAFLMQCQEEGGDQWITCRGGNNAIVYIY
jgi:hypothetical protein